MFHSDPQAFGIGHPLFFSTVELGFLALATIFWATELGQPWQRGRWVIQIDMGGPGYLRGVGDDSGNVGDGRGGGGGVHDGEGVARTRVESGLERDEGGGGAVATARMSGGMREAVLPEKGEGAYSAML